MQRPLLQTPGNVLVKTNVSYMKHRISSSWKVPVRIIESNCLLLGRLPKMKPYD